MKRITTALIAVLLLSTFAFSGGIVTNTNQSAAWTRYFARYATTDIDAVYFNPAGLSKLNDGFHFSLNNQSIWQTQTISNDFPYLVYGPDYVGDVKAPLFPGVYFAWKTGKFTISAGFNPIGGGGGATFNNGLPSFELLTGVNLVGMLNEMGIPTSQYTESLFFEGRSVYYGIQAGLTYEINDFISVAAGARYVMANNSYNGYLKDLMINPMAPPINDGSMVRADEFFVTASGLYAQASQDAAVASAGLTAAIGAGIIVGDDPLANQTLIDALTDVGVYFPGMTNTQAAGTFGIVSDEAANSALEAGATATLVTDQEVEYEQKGSGITPMLSVHLSPAKILDVAFKYEFKTKLQLTNHTTSDFLVGYDETGTPITMFPDGEVSNADMPALLSGAANVRPLQGLQLSVGFEYYWDKNVNWDGLENEIDNNSYNINGTAQYTIKDKVMISASYGFASMGVNKSYQSDLDYSLSSSSIGFGAGWNITENVTVNAGYVMVFYQDDSVPTGEPVMYTQFYGKDTNIFAVGVDFSF
ncbi:MAG: outer membrane beta-barrel protein [Bacteroidales bacterium]|nr:outer membrane beta-barrel protein [Bacteroidales bacterium]